ncbi:MAG: DUF2974 domain-containing protein [Clostridia bacterium]|nr:DUF2974 domain-containing protein [Clostridia bacterium]
MANLFDYLAGHGHLDFAETPLNPVDNLILAWLSYTDYQGIVPALGAPGSIAIADAVERFFKNHASFDKGGLLASLNPMLTSARVLHKTAETRRFGPVHLSCFVDRLDFERETQFAAVTMLIGEDLAYVSFRGTDHSLVGWKEDFYMSFMPSVPAQKEALAYLEAVAAHFPRRRLYVGGHSKGGNLAVYASVACAPEIQDRILTVYNNDGPGFQDEALLASDAYRRMLDRIETIVPQSSVVGMLLGHPGRYRIIKSAQMGLLQHNALNWEVRGAEFVPEPSVTRFSALMSLTLKEWLRELNEGQLREFVDTLFSALDATGAKTLEELTTRKLKLATGLFETMRTLDAETRRMLLTMLRMLSQARRDARRKLRDAEMSVTPPEQEDCRGG